MGNRVARNLESIKPNSLIVGVDLGLDRNVVSVIDFRARQLAHFAIGNSQVGYTSLRDRLERLRLKAGASEVLVAMEPTGVLWKPLAQWLKQQGLHYALVNPLTVHRHREGDNLSQAKDDPRDALAIAQLARTGVFTSTRLLEGPWATLRQLATRLETVSVEIARAKNRLHADVFMLFPEFSLVFKQCTGLTAQAVLESGLDPSVIAAMPFEQFEARVRAVFRGQRLQRSFLRRLPALAKTSIGYCESKDAFMLAVRHDLAALNQALAQQCELQNAMRQAVAQIPAAANVLTIKGLHPLTLGRILGEIGDPSAFERAKQLVKLAGIQPVPNSSGRRSRSTTPMSHHGRPGLRSILFYACIQVIKSEQSFARAYEGYQTRPHHAMVKMEAIGALMNKLLRVIWALLHSQTPYDASRAFAA